MRQFTSHVVMIRNPPSSPSAIPLFYFNRIDSVCIVIVFLRYLSDVNGRREEGVVVSEKSGIEENQWIWKSICDLLC